MFFLKISCFLIVICEILADDEELWLKFKEDYNKTYSSAEEEKTRRQAFFSNVKFIEKHNEDYKNGKSSYEMEINEFADMLPGEFKGNSILDIEDNLKSFTKLARSFNGSRVPDYVNWVERGYTNPVLKQGECGACYAFGAVAAIEAQYFIKHNKLISLSEQDVLNCGVLYGAFGCRGGKVPFVFDMVKKRGILFSNDEPYKAKEDTCKAKNLGKKGDNKPYVKIAKYHRLKPNEKELQKAVAKIGPITVVFQGMESFHFYKQGVYYEPNCKGTDFHVALVVGYGTTEKGEDYWIVRNSWGEDWGEKGHILMARNRGNNCDIAKFPFYPVSPVIMNDSNKIS